MGSEEKIVLTGGRVFDPDAGLDAELDVLIEGEKIAGVDAPGSFGDAPKKVDVSKCLVVPGLIDIHVHLREPGEEWKETVETGCRAAVAGGFTAICPMPNTRPANDNASVTELMLERAQSVGLCRVYPIGAITIGREGEALSPMLELREAGCVGFSDDGSPVMNSQIMRKALEYNLMTGAVLTVHQEDTNLSDGFCMNESELSLKLGLRGMPEAAENVMISRDIELARLTGGRVHFCHVSTARGALLIKRAKEDGIPVTAETTPHYLVADESLVENFDTNCKMSMPLRKKEDAEALARALEQGVIDCVASDHAPHEADSKNIEFDKASFGTTGLQTMLPLVLSLVRSGQLSLERAIQSLSTSAARCLNIEANSIVVGKPADITVIDLERKMTFSPEVNLSKSQNSMFMGWELQGVAVKTFVAGREVFDIGELNSSI